MSYGRMVLLCSLLALAAAVGGCQRGSTWNLAPVEGTITKDGHPLDGIEVIFLADAGTVGPKARGITDAAGHYRLRTDNGDDGVVVGQYRVCVVDLPVAAVIDPDSLASLQKPPMPSKPVERRRVPPRYGLFNETLLRAEVRSGPQTLDFNLP